MFEYSWRFLHTNKYKIHVFIYFGNWNMEIENEHLENQIKNKKKFEPVFSLRTGRFVRFTDWIAGSSGLIPVRSPSGLMTGPNWNNDRLAVQPIRPAGSPTGRTSRSGLVFKTMIKPLRKKKTK